MVASGLRLTSDETQTQRLQIDELGITFAADRLHLGWLGSSLIAFGGHLGSIWVPRASKMNAPGDQADNAKTIAAFSQVPWLGTIPYTPALAQVTPPCFNALPDEIQTTTQQLIDKIIP